MLDSINVGMAGLMSYSRGLKLVANNTTNLNTAGFKASAARFQEMARSAGAADTATASLGSGVRLPVAVNDFSQGELKQTGRSLDLALDGEGFFTLRTESGQYELTRAGQFRFNDDGTLVDADGRMKVCGRGDNGALTDISIAGRSVIAGEPTRAVSFSGNVSSAAAEPIVAPIRVVDAVGVEHSLSVRLSRLPDDATGSRSVELLSGDMVVGSGRLEFVDGRPLVGQSKVEVLFTPAGGAGSQSLTLDFSTDVTSFASGSLSSLAMREQDGVVAGSLTTVRFDPSGRLKLEYSNGKVVDGPSLLLGRFTSPESAIAQGGSRFVPAGPDGWRTGGAGQAGFGSIASGAIELSNVDLSREFSDLVVMQRGYQASSQVISTANEMLQELFAMKNK